MSIIDIVADMMPLNFTAEIWRAIDLGYSKVAKMMIRDNVELPLPMILNRDEPSAKALEVTNLDDTRTYIPSEEKILYSTGQRRGRQEPRMAHLSPCICLFNTHNITFLLNSGLSRAASRRGTLDLWDVS